MLIWLSISAQLLNRDKWMVWPGPRGKQIQKRFRPPTRTIIPTSKKPKSRRKSRQGQSSRARKSSKQIQQILSYPCPNAFSNNSSRSGASHCPHPILFISPASLMPFGTLRCANPGSPGHISTDHGGSHGPFQVQKIRRFAAGKQEKREEEKLEQQSSDLPTRPTDLRGGWR